MEEHSLDEENKAKYASKKIEWHQKYKDYYQQGTNSRGDKEQFDRYQKVIQELCPGTLEEFVDIKYNDAIKYKDLKRKYRILNQYKIDSGNLTATEILKLDWDIIRDKRNRFNSKTKKSGNIAGVAVDGSEKYYIAHSKIDDAKSTAYKGENTLVGLKEKRRYKYKDVVKSDGEIRRKTYLDTEAKLFEELAEIYEKEPFKRIDMLSERGMCDSCISVMEQFAAEHPDVEINVVSNKKVEGDVWKHRLKNKN